MIMFLSSTWGCANIRGPIFCEQSSFAFPYRVPCGTKQALGRECSPGNPEIGMPWVLSLRRAPYGNLLILQGALQIGVFSAQFVSGKRRQIRGSARVVLSPHEKVDDPTPKSKDVLAQAHLATDVTCRHPTECKTTPLSS